MSAHDWFIECRAEYATHILTGEELTRFTDHLAHCASCQAAVAELERELAWLPMGATPLAPPPGLTRRLTEGVLGRSPRQRRWVVPITIAAATILVTLVTWQAWQKTTRLSAEVEGLLAQVQQTDARLAATLDTLSVIRSATRVLQARLAMAGERAGLVIFEDAATHRWTVVVHGLPEAPAGERFALWWICENGMREGTSLPESLEGTAVLVVDMPQDLGAILSASITRESLPATVGAMPASKVELLNLRL